MHAHAIAAKRRSPRSRVHTCKTPLVPSDVCKPAANRLSYGVHGVAIVGRGSPDPMPAAGQAAWSCPILKPAKIASI